MVRHTHTRPPPHTIAQSRCGKNTEYSGQKQIEFIFFGCLHAMGMNYDLARAQWWISLEEEYIIVGDREAVVSETQLLLSVRDASDATPNETTAYVSCPQTLACFRAVGAGEAQFAGLHLRASSSGGWRWCSRIRVSSKFPGAADAVPSACFGTIGLMTRYHCPEKKKSWFRQLSNLVYPPGHREALILRLQQVWSSMFSFHAYGCCFSRHHNLTLPSKVGRTDQEAKDVVRRHLKPVTRISPIWSNLTGWGPH